MALIPAIVPVAVSIFALFYIFVAGRFIPGFRDETYVFMLMVVTWIVYSVLYAFESSISVFVGGNAATIILGLLVIGALVGYVLLRKRK